MVLTKREFLKLSVTLLAGAPFSSCSRGILDPKRFLIGLSQSTMNNTWRVAMVEGNRRYAAAHFADVGLIVTDAQNSAATQTSDVETLLARGVKVLLLSAVESHALVPATREAMAQGVKVITLDRKVDTPVTAHIGADNRDIGFKAGQFIAQRMNGLGGVIEIQGSAGNSTTIDRSLGFHEALVAFPGVKILATQNVDWTTEPARKFMEDSLQRFDSNEVGGVYAHNDDMALGAIQALEQTGRLARVNVVSIDGQESAIDAVKTGRMTATFLYPVCAPEGIQAAYRAVQGEAIPQAIVLPSPRVDSSNVDSYLGKGF